MHVYVSVQGSLCVCVWDVCCDIEAILILLHGNKHQLPTRGLLSVWGDVCSHSWFLAGPFICLPNAYYGLRGIIGNISSTIPLKKKAFGNKFELCVIVTFRWCTGQARTSLCWLEKEQKFHQQQKKTMLPGKGPGVLNCSKNNKDLETDF